MESFESKIKSVIDEVIGSYIEDVSNKYKIPKLELESLWKGQEKKETNKVVEKDYSKMKRNELIEVCKKRELSTSGTKKDLIKRILKKENKKENIVDKLDLSLNSVIIKKNSFGNYVHSPTRFVFNKDNKSVVGKEDEEGQILKLDKNDIDICNRYKFKFIVPEDLNTKDEDEVEEIIEDSDSEDSEEEEEDD
tara:strand:- start:6345 stop:6923 length:579 start_codon:yes stop_codon:yes gene_type:complete